MDASEPTIPQQDRDEIVRRLERIETDYNVKVLFAVESGSRAWGFPSPDSDYDVRFVYVHPRDWYLSIDRRRDVIELPIELPFDIGGWELRKALSLLIKSNPVLLEWLESPFRYLWNDEFCERITALADLTHHAGPITHHYWHMGTGEWRREIEGREAVSLKRYFYVIRPACALRWLRLHPNTRPPMNLQQVMDGIDLPSEIAQTIDGLIHTKRLTREMGEGVRLAALDAFLEAEFAEAELRADAESKPDLSSAANMLFRETLSAVWDG